MKTLKELERYLDYEFSSRSYTGEDYRQFQTKYINHLRTLCKQNAWELVNIGRNHYEFSAFIKNNGSYVYFSISDVRFWQNQWYDRILIRTATDERDYHGRHNNYTSLPNLKGAVGNLLLKHKKSTRTAYGASVLSNRCYYYLYYEKTIKEMKIMIELNLKTTTPEQEAIKRYLQENASKTLADKINNGVQTEVDGKPLVNRKHLDGFMSYAGEEAKKIAGNTAKSTCIEDKTVFGWAIHYFEEDSIIGSLYRLDNTEYKPERKATPKTSPCAVKATKTNDQMSLFDAGEESNIAQENTMCQLITEDGEIIDCEEIDEEVEEAAEETAKTSEKPNKTPQGSLLYQNYMRIQNAYPNSVIAIKLGDFYEVFGANAIKLAEEYNLTLTSRDCGLSERVPMIGFPYHSSKLYFNKIRQKYDLIIDESKFGVETSNLPKAKEVKNVAVNDEIVAKLKALFGADMEVRL